MDVFICRFDELARHDVKLAGGKGASLAELTRAGILVEEIARQIIENDVKLFALYDCIDPVI